MPESPSGAAPFDPDAVSSLPRIIAARNGPVSLVPSDYLDTGLPGLAAPPGWTQVASGGVPMTRMMLRRVGTASFWDGSEILNLYRVPGEVPRDVVLANADRSLRDSGAVDVYTSEVVLPPSGRTTGARAVGTIQTGVRSLRAQYTYYVVEVTGGTALIEQVIVIGVDVLARLLPEVDTLTNTLYRSLLTSIGEGPR